MTNDEILKKADEIKNRREKIAYLKEIVKCLESEEGYTLSLGLYRGGSVIKYPFHYFTEKAIKSVQGFSMDIIKAQLEEYEKDEQNTI